MAELHRLPDPRLRESFEGDAIGWKEFLYALWRLVRMVHVSKGAPDFDADLGHICLNVSGGVGTTFYVKQTAGIAGWFAVA